MRPELLVTPNSKLQTPDYHDRQAAEGGVVIKYDPSPPTVCEEGFVMRKPKKYHEVN